MSSWRSKTEARIRSLHHVSQGRKSVVDAAVFVPETAGRGVLVPPIARAMRPAYALREQVRRACSEGSASKQWTCWSRLCGAAIAIMRFTIGWESATAAAAAATSIPMPDLAVSYLQHALDWLRADARLPRGILGVAWELLDRLCHPPARVRARRNRLSSRSRPDLQRATATATTGRASSSISAMTAASFRNSPERTTGRRLCRVMSKRSRSVPARPTPRAMPGSRESRNGLPPASIGRLQAQYRRSHRLLSPGTADLHSKRLIQTAMRRSRPTSATLSFRCPHPTRRRESPQCSPRASPFRPGASTLAIAAAARIRQNSRAQAYFRLSSLDAAMDCLEEAYCSFMACGEDSIRGRASS